jgi:hypothetical protein
MTTPFRQHGKHHSYVEGRLIITEVTGPWNKELVDNWAKSVYPMAKQLSLDGPHIGIAIVEKSLMCPPDAYEALRQTVIFAATKLQCIGQIIVADKTVEGRNVLQTTFGHLYDGYTAHKFCYDLDEAKAYALELLRDYKGPPTA